MPFRARRRLAPLLSLATVLVPEVAAATKIAAVVRGAGAGSDKAAGFVSHSLRQALSEDGRYEVVDNAEPLGAVSPEVDKAFAEAKDLVVKAMGAYELLELDAAAGYLTTALQTYERNAAFVTDIKAVADTLMLLGAVYILRGEEKQGAERLAQATTVLPTIEPDPRVFNPSMRQVFQKAAEQLARRPRGALSLTSSPSYAEIYVDGIFRGVTPAVVEQLAPGRHYVRLVRDGYRSYGDLATVVAGRELAVNGTMKPAKLFDEYEAAVGDVLKEMRAAGADDDEIDDAALDPGEMLGAEHLFVAEVRLDADRVQILATQYDLKAKRRLKTATHAFTYDVRGEVFEREIGDLLRTQFGETTLARRTSPLAGGAAGQALGIGAGSCFGMSCDRFKRIALIGGAGGGAALTVIGSILYILAAGDNSEYRKMVQKDPRTATVLRSGKTKALIGDILVPLGVMIGAVGVSAYFLYQPAVAPDPQGLGVTMGFVPLQGGAAVAAGLRF